MFLHRKHGEGGEALDDERFALLERQIGALQLAFATIARVVVRDQNELNEVLRQIHQPHQGLSGTTVEVLKP